MYARSTTVRGNPQAMDDGIAYVRDTVMPAVRQMDGCIGLSMLADRDSGRCIVTTSWADADAMNASASGVMAMRQRAAEIMGGPADVQEWEIALMHRLHQAHHGACARVIWNDGDPADIDHMIDSFRMTVLPQLEDLPGCCSVSVMIDRDSGKAVVTTHLRQPAGHGRGQGPGHADAPGVRPADEPHRHRGGGVRTRPRPPAGARDGLSRPGLSPQAAAAGTGIDRPPRAGPGWWSPPGGAPMPVPGPQRMTTPA